MKICVVQARPVKGDIQQNIENHKRLINLAVLNKAQTVIFPELSLTGYEPALAKDLATEPNDVRFDDFQIISDTRQITIGVGIPLKTSTGICISMLLFQPNQPRQIYSKQHLHLDEEPFFVSGKNTLNFINNKPKTALAICYEILVTEHAESAFKNGAEVYIASVVKSVRGIDKALNRLSDIAEKYAATVLMSNSIGKSDNEECAGKTSIWNDKGILIAQLDDTNEGILIIDTDTQQIIKKTI